MVSPCKTQVLDEIRPYLIGTGGGGLEHVGLDGPICKVRITGPAAKVRDICGGTYNPMQPLSDCSARSLCLPSGCAPHPQLRAVQLPV